MDPRPLDVIELDRSLARLLGRGVVRERRERVHQRLIRAELGRNLPRRRERRSSARAAESSASTPSSASASTRPIPDRSEAPPAAAAFTDPGCRPIPPRGLPPPWFDRARAGRPRLRARRGALFRGAPRRAPRGGAAAFLLARSTATPRGPRGVLDSPSPPPRRSRRRGRGVRADDPRATTSSLTPYSTPTCASACANPSKDITLGAMDLAPAPCLHLAKITAAVASAHLAPISPHARPVTSHSAGFIPCFDPANCSNDARRARRWSRCMRTSSGALYAAVPVARRRCDSSRRAASWNASSDTCPSVHPDPTLCVMAAVIAAWHCSGRPCAGRRRPRARGGRRGEPRRRRRRRRRAVLREDASQRRRVHRVRARRRAVRGLRGGSRGGGGGALRAPDLRGVADGRGRGNGWGALRDALRHLAERHPVLRRHRRERGEERAVLTATPSARDCTRAQDDVRRGRVHGPADEPAVLHELGPVAAVDVLDGLARAQVALAERRERLERLAQGQRARGLGEPRGNLRRGLGVHGAPKRLDLRGELLELVGVHSAVAVGTSAISNNSPALLARTPSSAPMSANATDTSPKSRYPEPSTS